MENSQLDPSLPISVLTVADLEALLTKVVRQVIRQEITSFKVPTKSEATSAYDSLEAFMETFGAWEDERTTEEIIKDIYDSRSTSNVDKSL
jgi:hypothetical protein